MTSTTPTHAAIPAVTPTITDISLPKLVPRPPTSGIPEPVRASRPWPPPSQAHGLLQSLVVRPTRDPDGRETDCYEVVAGGRRLAALRLPEPSY